MKLPDWLDRLRRRRPVAAYLELIKLAAMPPCEPGPEVCGDPEEHRRIVERKK